MQVEELYNTEAETQHPECSEEALKILEELGLTLQMGFYQTEENVTEVEFPFKPATEEELFVYHVNFPEQTKIETFNMEVIPFRVLEILKKAKDTGKFDCFKIWHKKAANIKEDPVLVGVIVKEGLYQTKNYSYYLLARWGEALKSYAELKAEAFKEYREKTEAKLQKVAREVAVALTDLGRNKIPDLNGYGGDVRLPQISFYAHE